MNGHDEVQSGKNGGESNDKDGKSGLNDFCVAEGCAERSVEGPASVHAAGQYGVHHENAGDDVEVPAEQIDSGEGQIPGSNHQWNKKVSQNGGDGRNQKEEHHDLAVHGEELVVSVGLNKIAGGSEQLKANQQGEQSADKEEERNRSQVEQRNALVVGGKQPRPYAVLLVQIILAFGDGIYCGSHFHCTFGA